MKAITKIKRTVESTDPEDRIMAVEFEEGSANRILIRQDDELIVLSMDMARAVREGLASLLYEIDQREGEDE